MMENFNFQNDSEIRARNDMELIKKYFDDQMSWLYWDLKNHREPNTNIKRIKAIPEKLLRRYIEEEEIIQDLLRFEYAVWYIRFEPNKTFRDFKEEFKKNLVRQKAESKYISEQMKMMREQWAMTKENRFLTKLNKLWQHEQSFRSFKKPIYIWTTSELFWNARSFYEINWFNYIWKVPYLVIDTNKQTFIHKITRLWFKSIIEELKEIRKAQQNSWLDEDFNIIRNPMIDVHIENIKNILASPLKEITEEENQDNIDKNDEDLTILDFD